MVIKKWLFLFLSLIFLVSFTSCVSNRSATKETAKPKKAASKAIPNKIPPSSIFAKIDIGMAEQQVFDIIGRGSDMKVILSGKQWNPFYYGTDTTRKIHYYKKEGRIVFAGGNDRLIQIVYDATEDGYKN